MRVACRYRANLNYIVAVACFQVARHCGGGAARVTMPVSRPRPPLSRRGPFVRRPRAHADLHPPRRPRARRPALPAPVRGAALTPRLPARAVPRRPRVSFLVHDLGGNPIVRAAPLAAALEEEFEVEVLGLVFGGAPVYAPFRDRFEYRVVRAGRSPAAVLAGAARLSRLATGDVLYACKPLHTTLWPAVRAAAGRPVLLDVEDDEWAARQVDEEARGLRASVSRLADVHRLLARAVHPLTRRAAAVTVASRALQARYGGTLVRHGPDEAAFDPARPALADRAALRTRLGLPVGRRIALFAGVPRPHKGWAVLLDALERPEAAAWDLAVAGDRGGDLHARAAARLGPRFHALGAVPYGAMPELAAAADAVPVPQREGAVARAQVPAKALEAMAMALPVVGTAVGDLPELLGEGRGWIVPPDDAPALARALAEIAADPDAARRRGEAARAWYLAEAGTAAIRSRVAPLVRAALAGGDR
jgi:glycosyltransferase involved in cell wall biosynthesis